jgi:hypothetical protein
MADWPITHPATICPKANPPNKGKRKLADTDDKKPTSDKPTKKTRAATLKGKGREEAASTSRHQHKPIHQVITLRGLPHTLISWDFVKRCCVIWQRSWEQIQMMMVEVITQPHRHSIAPANFWNHRRGPAILPEELEIVRRSILHTILPSRIVWVPQNLITKPWISEGSRVVIFIQALLSDFPYPSVDKIPWRRREWRKKD